MTSQYFNNFNNSGEQNLLEDLIVESIKIYGHSIYYCPRTLGAMDEIYGEDRLSSYDSAYEFDMYIKSYDSYEGDGSFLSKFNLQVRDSITLSVAKRTFENEIAVREGTSRPEEGDVIYSPMMKRLFIVKYVNTTPIFYQMGSLQMWDVSCDMFEYANERFNTGIDEIDAMERNYTTDGVDAAGFEDAMLDVFATNEEFQDAGNTVVDWSTSDPFSEGSI